MGKPQNIGSKSHIQQTQQEMGNQSFDSLFDISVIEPLEYVPAGAREAVLHYENSCGANAL